MINGWTFTITDLARMLGKSPVTIRGWEKKGIIVLPRQGPDRKLHCDDVRHVAKIAHDLKRISTRRYQLVMSAIFLMEEIEKETK